MTKVLDAEEERAELMLRIEAMRIVADSPSSEALGVEERIKLANKVVAWLKGEDSSNG